MIIFRLLIRLGRNHYKLVRTKISCLLDEHKEWLRMQKLHAKAQLIQGFQITLDNGRSHCVTVDQPADMGTDLGPTSLELCVMSHAGCYVTIFALTARKCACR